MSEVPGDFNHRDLGGRQKGCTQVLSWICDLFAWFPGGNRRAYPHPKVPLNGPQYNANWGEGQGISPLSLYHLLFSNPIPSWLCPSNLYPGEVQH